jgi:hypothetical protein
MDSSNGRRGQALIRNKTFLESSETEAHSAGIKVIGSRWVFRTKHNEHDNSVHHKARLVIKGYQQGEIDNTFAPVAQWTTFRTFISFAAAHNHKIDHLDVVTAFLNPEVDDENILMKLPPGFTDPNNHLNGTDTVRLFKALYGLKTAPRLWYEHITKFLLNFSFKAMHSDSNLFKTKSLLLLLYVDDMALSHDTMTPAEIDHANKLKKALSDEFQISDLGTIRKFLGVHFIHADNAIALHQIPYIESIVKDHPDAPTIAMLTPLDKDVKLWGVSGEESEADVTQYAKLIGRFNWLSQTTHPDISYTVALLSQYLVKPLSKHMTQALRCVAYLNTTKHLGLTYERNGNFETQGFCDADHANDMDNRKSQGGQVFIANGGAISWKSKKQPVVSTSTYEAEYISCSEAAREAKWLRLLHSDLGLGNRMISVKMDHQDVLSFITGNADLSERSKSIDICYHNSRDLHRAKSVEFSRVASADNPADLFTKALPLLAHRKFVEMIGMKDIRTLQEKKESKE